jgi:peptidoglycan/LPS O-acetylase OafA/YrhL
MKYTEMQMRTTRDNPNLDLIRSLAVLFVVAFHVLLLFHRTHLGPFNLHSLGIWGVLLFFVHTSVVLMFSLERQGQRTKGTGLFWVFYVRRCFRIYPLSILVVVVVALFRLPVWDLHGVFLAAQFSSREILSNILLIQNLTHAESIIAVLWSLPFEMQMYLVLPALFLIVRASRGILPVLGIWVGAVIVVLAAIRLNHFAGLLIYLPCFVPGIIAYKLTKLRQGNLPFYLLPGFIAVVTVMFLRNPVDWMGWICCLLTGVAIPEFREMTSARLKTVCHLIARYSYGIYLTHLICLWLAFDKLSGLPIAGRWLVFLLSLGAIPVALYHTIEKPMIDLGSRWIEHFARKRRPHDAMVAES